VLCGISPQHSGKEAVHFQDEETETNWISQDPHLEKGELGFKFKPVISEL
jgi:hypothetical protein